EGIAAEQVEPGVYGVIDPDIELVGIIAQVGIADIVVVELAWEPGVGRRTRFGHLKPNRIDEARRNYPAVTLTVVTGAAGCLLKIRAFVLGIVGIDDRHLEESVCPICLRYAADLQAADAIAQTFVVDEPKRAILADGAAEGAAELIPIVERLGRIRAV